MKDEFGYSNKEDARAHQQDLEEERRESQRRNKRSNSESYAHTALHDSIISPLIASLRTGRSEEEKRKEMDRCKKFIGIHHLNHSLNIICQMLVSLLCCLTREQHQRL